MSKQDFDVDWPEGPDTDGEVEFLRGRLEEMQIEYRALQDEVGIAPYLLQSVYDKWRSETGRQDEILPWWEVLEWVMGRIQ